MKINIELSKREKALIGVSTTCGLVLGMWLGIWSVPAEALNVPSTYNEGRLILTYRPVTTGHLLATVFMPAIALLSARGYLRADDQGDETATTGAASTPEVTSADD